MDEIGGARRTYREKRKAYHVSVVKLRLLGKIKGRCEDSTKGILKKRDKTAS